MERMEADLGGNVRARFVALKSPEPIEGADGVLIPQGVFTDSGKEDATILDAAGQPVCFLEIRGANRGIRREDINQVDSHRERSGVTSATPGALIFNDEMEVVGLTEGLATPVHHEQVAHAARMNVLVVRTIDLLFLMRHTEAKPIHERAEELLKLLNSGGGWLNASEVGYQVEKGA